MKGLTPYICPDVSASFISPQKLRQHAYIIIYELKEHKNTKAPKGGFCTDIFEVLASEETKTLTYAHSVGHGQIFVK